MTMQHQEIARVVGENEPSPTIQAANAPTQELSIDHFRQSMFDAALQGLIDTLDRLYYLRMLIQSSVAYQGELERVISLNDLEGPIQSVRALAERVQHQQELNHTQHFYFSPKKGL
jgi:hypothetical protein